MIDAEIRSPPGVPALPGAAGDALSIDPTFAFREGFGLQATPARVLANLYRRGPDCWSSVPDVSGWLRYGGKDAVRQAIMLIRRALGAEAVEQSPELGYRLTENAAEVCRKALCRLGAGLLEAA